MVPSPSLSIRAKSIRIIMPECILPGPIIPPRPIMPGPPIVPPRQSWCSCCCSICGCCCIIGPCWALAAIAPHARMKVDVVSTRTCFCILNLLRNTPLPTNSARAILILRPRRRQQLRVNIRCPVDEKSDHRHRLLLCPRHERPCGRRAAEQRDELAALHSITSSASASSSGGLSSPSAFAVREWGERAAYLARFQTDSTTTPCPIDATGLVYRSSSPASVNDRF